MLFERERSGEGQHVEVAMLDAVLSLFADNAANVLTEGTKFPKFGSGHPELVPYQSVPASNGWFIVACLTSAFYTRLATALGREDLLTEPPFATNPPRVAPPGEVVGVLSNVFKQNMCEHWIALLEANDIPTCRVNRLEDAIHSEQSAVNGLVLGRDDPKRGHMSVLGPPVHLWRTPTTFERLAPMIGEHTDKVLHELGLADDEIATLRASRVI